jgi:hypothetical protein
MVCQNIHDFEFPPAEMFFAQFGQIRFGFARVKLVPGYKQNQALVIAAVDGLADASCVHFATSCRVGC